MRKLAPAKEIERRYGAIVDFEKQLTDAGTRIVKVMLHISSDEQKERLHRRLNRPDKHWKFNPSDIDERGRWDEYMDAYQIALERTSTDHAPWYVVPANHKWYARVAVQELLHRGARRHRPAVAESDVRHRGAEEAPRRDLSPEAAVRRSRVRPRRSPRR